MNYSQFKDPVSHIYLAGAVVVSWSQTQGIADWNGLLKTKIFVTEFSKII